MSTTTSRQRVMRAEFTDRQIRIVRPADPYPD
jgi:hypothetical protein